MNNNSASWCDILIFIFIGLLITMVIKAQIKTREEVIIIQKTLNEMGARLIRLEEKLDK